MGTRTGLRSRTLQENNLSPVPEKDETIGDKEYTFMSEISIKKASYLNGDLEEEVIMEAPKFFEVFLQNVIDFEGNSEIGTKAKRMLHDFQRGNEVCLLKKAFMDLDKQAEVDALS